MFPWYVDGRGFDPNIWQHSFVEIGHELISMAPHIRQHSFMEIGHELISMAILSLPSLIQEGQLLVTGERMCTKYR